MVLDNVNLKAALLRDRFLLSSPSLSSQAFGDDASSFTLGSPVVSLVSRKGIGLGNTIVSGTFVPGGVDLARRYLRQRKMHLSLEDIVAYLCYDIICARFQPYHKTGGSSQMRRERAKQLAFHTEIDGLCPVSHRNYSHWRKSPRSVFSSPPPPRCLPMRRSP